MYLLADPHWDKYTTILHVGFVQQRRQYEIKNEGNISRSNILIVPLETFFLKNKTLSGTIRYDEVAKDIAWKSMSEKAIQPRNNNDNGYVGENKRAINILWKIHVARNRRRNPTRNRTMTDYVCAFVFAFEYRLMYSSISGVFGLARAFH